MGVGRAWHWALDSYATIHHMCIICTQMNTATRESFACLDVKSGGHCRGDGDGLQQAVSMGDKVSQLDDKVFVLPPLIAARASKGPL